MQNKNEKPSSREQYLKKFEILKNDIYLVQHTSDIKIQKYALPKGS